MTDTITVKMYGKRPVLGSIEMIYGKSYRIINVYKDENEIAAYTVELLEMPGYLKSTGPETNKHG